MDIEKRAQTLATEINQADGFSCTVDRDQPTVITGYAITAAPGRCSTGFAIEVLIDGTLLVQCGGVTGVRQYVACDVVLVRAVIDHELEQIRKSFVATIQAITEPKLHSRTLVYCAGPFSAKDREGVEMNIRRMEDLGVLVAQLGAMPIIPHANTSDLRFERLHSYEFWIAGTLELMRRCDAVMLERYWRESSGARAEVVMAKRLEIPVFDSESQLDCWLGGRRSHDFEGKLIESRFEGWLGGKPIEANGTPAFHSVLARRVYEAAYNVMRNRDSAGLKNYVDTLTRIMGEEP